jgi:hypothetical protein
MGAASSMLNIDVYISYSEKNKYIDFLENQLNSLNYNIVNSYVLTNSINEIDNSQVSKYIKMIIQKTNFVIICLSKNTVKSYSQSFELNELIELKENQSFDKYKIIYLLIDSDYIPSNNKSLEIYLQNKRWFPFYNEETYTNSFDKILSIVFSS